MLGGFKHQQLKTKSKTDVKANREKKRVATCIALVGVCVQQTHKGSWESSVCESEPLNSLINIHTFRPDLPYVCPMCTHKTNEHIALGCPPHHTTVWGTTTYNAPTQAVYLHPLFHIKWENI